LNQLDQPNRLVKPYFVTETLARKLFDQLISLVFFLLFTKYFLVRTTSHSLFFLSSNEVRKRSPTTTKFYSKIYNMLNNTSLRIHNKSHHPIKKVTYSCHSKNKILTIASGAYRLLMICCNSSRSPRDEE